MLTIGEVAKATGVATSALRYWEELGLVPPPVRESGQRRYPPETRHLVGRILLLRDSGFTLTEIKAMLTRDDWRDIAQRKLVELDERIAAAQTARHAIAHALACEHQNLRDCPTAARIVDARLAGIPLNEAHAH
jgi:DNA-binding transcriptional MerR regulator